MPQRNNPTARQVRLGTELRKMRERAAMTGREAAQQLGVSPMQMSHMETARVGVSGERVRKLASQYGCQDDELVDALAAMTRGRQRGWWEDYRETLHAHLLDLAEFEYHARRLRAIQIVHVPGLLQTKTYARAMFGQSMPELNRDNLEEAVEFRMRRRQIFEREDSPELDAVIHEAALRIRVGDGKVAREQLDFLAERADHHGVNIRVIPFETDGFTGSGFSVHYMEGLVEQLDTAQFDTVHGSFFVDDEIQLASYRTVIERVGRMALSPRESQQLIHRIAQET